MIHVKKKSETDYYKKFDQIDGYHPWQEASPDGFVLYPVRELRSGKVTYFNFVLAKEMGLIDNSHPHLMNSALEKKLISTFSLQIINEFDELSKRRILESSIKPNKYMATRYLQLQHSNKKGKTSGDGRGIWNGCVNHKGKKWDISSRGTGVTCLAPGSVEANKPLRTGAGEFGYGCGLAEMDELLSAAILSEIIHLQGINTERVLCVIDLGKGYGIGVRSSMNLIRPAHLFRYLKLEKYEDLKKSVDYFLERQCDNDLWKISLQSSNRYNEMLKIMTREFAEFTAVLDMEYIFAWLDWDGDNVLASAGIIDYGSVRQFGSRHDRYRYDDVERFSTNLNEQKDKAKYLIQVFAQIVDYLNTKNKKNIKFFQKHKCLQEFDELFKNKRAHRMLYRLGFSESERIRILKHAELFQKFDNVFTYFEKAKISGSIQKVADGVNHPPLFNLRNILRTLPFEYKNDFKSLISNDGFFKTILSQFAKSKDTKIRKKHQSHIEQFQILYKELVKVASTGIKIEKTMDSLCRRASKINSEKRITGNALIEIVDQIIAEKDHSIQNIMERIISENKGIPEARTSKHYETEELLMKIEQSPPELYSRIIKLVSVYKDDI